MRQQALKLCWIIPDDHGGGVASVALSCCRQAVAAGHEVMLLMALPPQGHHTEHAGGFQLSTLGIHPGQPDAPERLVQWLDDNRPDVVVFNGCSEVEPALPHVPEGIRSVYVIHDTAASHWQAMLQHEAALDAVVAVSETVANLVRPRMKRPDKLHVLLNGTIFPPLPHVNLRPDDLVFLGGGQPAKGAGDVTKLWLRLVERGFEGHLHWFGTEMEALSEPLGRLPSRERVILHGRVPRSVIFEQASRSKVLLMLSRVEPFGMATVEGMGMGAVPVAWDIDTGTREIVTAGETGLFAPLGDYEALADRVIEACARHTSLAPRAMEVARMQFSEEAMWERYASLITSLRELEPVHRPRAGTKPSPFRPPVRFFQLLPEPVRRRVRALIGWSPRLGYLVRDLRGI